ncbi:MAG TPA: AraC family transcriptional regulator [Streptosporangiales bacterium]
MDHQRRQLGLPGRDRWRRLSGYRTPSAAHRALGLVCLGAGVQHGPVPPVEARTLGHYAAVLVTAGSGHLALSSPPFRADVDAPLLFYLHSGMCHSYAPDERGWSERWVLFDGAATRAYAELGYLPADPPVVGLRQVAPVADVLDRLVQVCRRDEGRADVEAAVLVHELLVTVRRQTMPAPHEPDQVAVVAAVRAGACTAMSVADRARELGLSVKALRAAVRAVAGCGPRELVLRVRLNEAKTLLAESHASVARVARMVGYDDPAYFSRLFTRRVGITPRDFRHQETRHRPERSA